MYIAHEDPNDFFFFFLIFRSFYYSTDYISVGLPWERTYGHPIQ
jgi:hypothetical protein